MGISPIPKVERRYGKKKIIFSASDLVRAGPVVGISVYHHDDICNHFPKGTRCWENVDDVERCGSGDR